MNTSAYAKRQRRDTAEGLSARRTRVKSLLFHMVWITHGWAASAGGMKVSLKSWRGQVSRSRKVTMARQLSNGAGLSSDSRYAHSVWLPTRRWTAWWYVARVTRNALIVARLTRVPVLATAIWHVKP